MLSRLKSLQGVKENEKTLEQRCAKGGAGATMWPAKPDSVAHDGLRVHEFQNFPTFGEVLRVSNCKICAWRHQFKCTCLLWTEGLEIVSFLDWKTAIPGPGPNEKQLQILLYVLFDTI